MKKFKFFIAAILFVCLASSHPAQALTMQQIIAGQTGRVPGAATAAFARSALVTAGLVVAMRALA